jgi:cyclic beta-1,2-glucan synthetase
MNGVLATLLRERWFTARRPDSPWNDTAPVRQELFSVERLEQHAQSLAAAQTISDRPPRVSSLRRRLDDNASLLLKAYRSSAAELESGHAVVPAAEWLLDNYHVVEAQILQIRDDLPVGYYRQLPKLAEGPFAGYPRVFGLAWAYIAHTDSHIDLVILRRFIVAYQQVQPLTIGELWAVAITLRIVLIENLRRLAEQIIAAQQARADADTLANQCLAKGCTPAELDSNLARLARGPLSELFASQLAKRLRDQDPHTTPALVWLEQQLPAQGSSIEDVVHNAHQRQGASNVSVRNVITSMRLISDIDWAELFESVSLVDARLRAASDFADMDFPSRNLYRQAIETIARNSSCTELELTDRVVQQARLAAASASVEAQAERTGDPGYHLLGEGRRALENSVDFHPSRYERLRREYVALGMGGYVGTIALIALMLLALSCWVLAASGLTLGWLGLLALVGVLPATEVATALTNRAISRFIGAVCLPALELRDGIPESLRTMVVVPTLLSTEAELLEQIERLEVHFLSSAEGALSFALLSDGLDADEETLPHEAQLLATAGQAFEQLNQRHGPGSDGEPRFYLLHRRRLFNPSQGTWMGWERKRGKLHEFNRLLRGATDTTFMSLNGQPPRVPANVRFVITLDMDTRLPRDTVLRLIGKIAHPLNRPHFDVERQRVVDGYAILQPRVTPSLPVGREGSWYQRLYSSPGGLDPYVAAVSDVYQDLFGQGSYTGKGIYDVDAFEAALRGRVPDNTLLSHDLFEGEFARSGLASDLEVVEEYPSRYDVDAKRFHRWTRGDWQLLPWIFGPRTGKQALSPIGLGKMLDNLRRSLLQPFTLALLFLCWLLPMPAALAGVLLVLASLAIPALLPLLFAVVPQHSGIQVGSHLRMLGGELQLAAMRIFFAAVFLPDHAWRNLDAIVRTLTRLWVTHRQLLEWTTAAQSSSSPTLDLRGFYRQMAGGTALGLALAAVALLAAPASWPLVLPFALLWLAAPALALWSSWSTLSIRQLAFSEEDRHALRLIARRTWRYFETFVTETDNWLPPDNYQETPLPAAAHRTSPTNIGLYLLSAVAARDFGWAGTLHTLERLEATFATLHRLPRLHGHFYNWYTTDDLRTLAPPYVSSVDSGNLAGHLLVLANACEEWQTTLVSSHIRQGLQDTCNLAREALVALPVASSEAGRRLTTLLDEIDAQLKSAQRLETLTPMLRRRTDKAASLTRDLLPEADGGAVNLLFWIAALNQSLTDHERDRSTRPQDLTARLQAVAKQARELAMAMDFAFLFDHDRKLLSIGYSAVDNHRDANCYDLLASEARLASLFAIAKGDLPTRHWFRLGRTATPLGNGSALISWSGSMFEYLMPSLVMRAPAGSLLDQTNRLVVARQEAYGNSLGIPWGISESAYNARDLEFTYQYSNFGVPGLGLKRGLAENQVVAPYATGLAAMIDPSRARRNFDALAELGALGRYGFYEALDYTRSRVPDDQKVAIVRSYMAHHQGMTIVAITNALLEGVMRRRFHSEPIIQATELLLQERMPRDVAIAHPRAEEVKVSPVETQAEVAAVRRINPATGGAPTTHLLSNGRYTVMLSATGAGYSRWRNIAVTRWREDMTRDECGMFIFLRDVHSGAIWSATAQPVGSTGDSQEVLFSEDHAEYTRHDGRLTTTLDVVVSGEDDGEVRRVTLTNSGRHAREIELTSYAELVLTTPSTDNAHPAFAKMFVQTEYLAEFAALAATRRRRSPDEPEVWAAHFAVVEGEIAADPQYESDRARFLGRGRRIGAAVAIVEDRPLSNTIGTVLDPIFALRQRVRIEPDAVARIAFWTVIAPTRDALLDLIDTHHDYSAFERAKTLSWTLAQVQLRYLDMKADEAADFQRLAAPLLYSDPRFRAPSPLIIRGAGPQSGLWSQSISGDLAIILLRIDELEDLPRVRQLLRAHEYWRMKGLCVDLVIINERSSSYVQDLQGAIEATVRSSQSRPAIGEECNLGSVFTLRADLMSQETRALLQSVARVALIARRGPIADQLARLPELKANALVPPPLTPPAPQPAAPVSRLSDALEFFNGLGGFAQNGREYVTVLDAGQVTPMPWINVIANPAFGFQVSAHGSGYTWAQNSRENQLTPWTNDPVLDPAVEVLYVRDEASGAVFGPTAQPLRDDGRYVARHGFGYSRFEHEAHGIALDLLQYVPLDDPVKISRLTLHNRSGQPRRLSVTAYAEWVLGTSRSASAPYLITERDASGALLARNPWSLAFAGRVAFADLAGKQTAWTADRSEFLGRNGGTSAPAALLGNTPLAGTVGAGFDPCAVLQCSLELGIDARVEVVWLLGQGASVDETRTLIERYRTQDLDGVLTTVTEHWQGALGAVQVQTPDRAMDILLNGWLLYQTLACRLWARSAFYQASGAYGFRDQLQDSLALLLTQPDIPRHHLLRAASRQFVEGDMQHWWLPHSGQGVRTRISDDRVWLAFATASYVLATGDEAILDEPLTFLEGPPLAPGQHDAFFQPMVAEQSASLFEHCARGLDQCLELSGRLGLPLIGTGDWNDGMSRVGEGGQGESVWLGWLLLRTLALFIPLAQSRDAPRAQRWDSHAAALREAMERQAWDGQWYRRATYDDGTWLGSRDSEECRIDSIAQSWAALSGAADPQRAATAMASLEEQLIRRDDGLALLFTPPFDKTLHDPGYIKGYPPGLRENGGQYTHAALWALLAFTQLGNGDKAGELFALLNPINHALTPDATERYKVEPYVIAADVYSVAPHTGRGGWTWYTGSAGWMYRAGLEGILGIRREATQLIIDPCIPAAWPGFDITLTVQKTHYRIRVDAPTQRCRGITQASLDDAPLECCEGQVRLPLDGGTHRVQIVIGDAA